jgi:hypothetical protein
VEKYQQIRDIQDSGLQFPEYIRQISIGASNPENATALADRNCSLALGANREKTMSGSKIACLPYYSNVLHLGDLPFVYALLAYVSAFQPYRQIVFHTHDILQDLVCLLLLKSKKLQTRRNLQMMKSSFYFSIFELVTININCLWYSGI